MLKKAVVLSVFICMLGTLAWANDYPLWKVYNDYFVNVKYVDLTHAFSPDIPVWDGFEEAKFIPAKADKELEKFTNFKKDEFLHYELLYEQVK